MQHGVELLLLDLFRCYRLSTSDLGAVVTALRRLLDQRDAMVDIFYLWLCRYTLVIENR